MKHSTKFLGLALAVFGGLQAMSGQFHDLLSPLPYAIFTLVVGIAFTVLGRLKEGTGGFLNANKLTIAGVLTVVVSVVQGVSTQFEILLSPNVFMVFNIAVGLIAIVIGFLNSAQDPPPTI